MDANSFAAGVVVGLAGGAVLYGAVVPAVRRYLARTGRAPRLTDLKAARTVWSFQTVPPDRSTEWKASTARFITLLELVQGERGLPAWRVPSYSMMRQATGVGTPKLKAYYDILIEARIVRVTGRAVTRWTCPKRGRRVLLTALPWRQASAPPFIPAHGTAVQAGTAVQDA